MTSYRSSFTLRPEAYQFLKQVAGDNHSAYINQLILREKEKYMIEWIERSNREEAQEMQRDEDYRLWEATLADGLDDETH